MLHQLPTADSFGSAGRSPGGSPELPSPVGSPGGNHRTLAPTPLPELRQFSLSVRDMPTQHLPDLHPGQHGPTRESQQLDKDLVSERRKNQNLMRELAGQPRPRPASTNVDGDSSWWLCRMLPVLPCTTRVAYPAEELTLELVQKLGARGITDATQKLLRDAGFLTCEALRGASYSDLLANGLEDEEAQNVMEACKEVAFLTCSQLASRAFQTRITTGSADLDSLLDGGILWPSITKVYGERENLTELCHALCVTVQLPIALKGAGGKAIYIDTQETTFSPERISFFADAKWVEVEAAGQSISVGMASTQSGVASWLAAAANLARQDPTYALVILHDVKGLGHGALCWMRKLKEAGLAVVWAVSQGPELGASRLGDVCTVVLPHELPNLAESLAKPR